MGVTIGSVCLAFFNKTTNFVTRLLLILLSASVYNGFVIAEVLLNNSNLWYPPWLSKANVELQRLLYNFVNVYFATVARKTVMMPWFLRRFLRFLVSLLAIIVIPITWIVNKRRNGTCPPPTNPLLFKSATTLTMMIRNKQIKSEQVVSAYIERCREVNHYLNAIVEPRYELALRDARLIDKMLEAYTGSTDMLAEMYPLLGLPMTVKESIAVEGMCNDSGTDCDVRNPAKKDAEIVRLARAAGAIPIAVTNTPQLCMNWETYNNVTGITLNPYNLKHTAGGSSGGEAALISAAASIMGVGSDIAGSLRLPPMFTGIFGHKPTPKLLSVEGHIPDSLDPQFEEYFTLGPLTRYAEDLPLLLNVLKQPGSPEIPFDKPIDFQKIKFYYMDGEGSDVTDKIGPDVKKAMDKAKGYIQHTYNVEVEELKIKNIEHMWEISVRVLFKIEHIRNIYTDPERQEFWVSTWPEVLKKLLGVSRHNFTCVAYGPVKKFFDALPSGYYKKLVEMFEEIKTDFQKALSENAVLFFPTFPNPAHVHYKIFYKFLNCGYLTIFNALGLPVTACPVGFTDKGLPVGIQIVAGRYNDYLTVAVAKEFEKAFGGWIPPNTSLETVQKYKNVTLVKKDINCNVNIGSA
ncbi:PREDICTED: fatty-acid amide hydrolase 2-B-like isoform X1 [Papilio xuthus]|uniref:Fatty-acid amide hydrolase 2-B-like isoform X1 n=2 Tax=Papilio xuthus TaxID=66420 RepID=A0AAJ7E6N6_PAPXU|nr:PREDICTED: fatty-acid amide hydrolase 2-B-like isoform X1 [Papilio xuthus]